MSRTKFDELPLISETFWAVRCALYFGPWLVQLFIADILLAALLPFSTILPDLCYELSSRIAESIWRGLQRIFTCTSGAAITVSGAEKLPEGESAIVVSNHVGWTDVYMVQELADRAGMLGRCRWFAKKQLKWVPFLGWGLWSMRMPLVSRKWSQDENEIARVFQGVLQRKWPMWLIAYSEATRYSSTKRLEAEAWCTANDKRLGQHLLYPRTKGFVACVQRLRAAAHVKAVYDVTIAYAKHEKVFQSPPPFYQTVLLRRLDEQWRFYVHVDRYLIADLPDTDEALAQWLEDRWIEKGDQLEMLRKKLEDRTPW